MARFLGYDIDLSRADEELRALLPHTTPRSLVLVDVSCCGESASWVFTMRGGKDAIDAAVLRPG